MRNVARVTSLFAAIWWTVGIWAPHASPLLYCIPFVVSAFIIGTAWRQDRNIAASTGDRRPIGRVVGIASACEGVAILAAPVFLPDTQQVDFSVSFQAVIVSLRFILLARCYYVTAALFVGLVMTGFAIGNADLRIQYVCLGAACTLWLSYAMTMTRIGYRRCPSIPSGATCS